MLHKLVVKNSIYFKNSLGILELNIDFEKYKGITLLLGENGLGKTSILEFALPYRFMPSRMGTYNQHFIDGEGSVSRVWTINGIKYDFILECKGNITTCYIYKLDGNKSKTILRTTKTSNYDEAVEEIIGPHEIVLRTMFKNKEKNFNTLTDVDKKEFFLYLIGAKVYEDYKEIAKQKRIKVSNNLEFTKKQLEPLITFNNENKVDIIKQDIIDIDNKIENIKTEISKVKINISNHSTKEMSMMQLETLNKLKEDKENLVKDITSQLQTLTIEKETNDKEISRKDEFDNSYKALSTKLANLKTIEKKYYELVNELRDVTAKKHKFIDYSSIFEKINNQRNAYFETQKITQDLKSRFEQARQDTCPNDPPGCKKVDLANELQNQYEASNEKLNSLTLITEDEIKDTLIRFNLIEKPKDDDKPETEEEIRVRNLAVIQQVKTDIDRLSKDEIRLEKELGTIKDESFTDKELLENSISVLSGNIHKINSLIFNNDIIIKKIKELTESNKELNQEITDLKEKIKEAESKDEETLIKDLEQIEKDLDSEKENLIIEKAHKGVLLTNIDTNNSSIDKLNQEIDNLDKEVDNYKFIEQAFSMKEGIPSLKLKNSGTEIVKEINKILDIFNEQKEGICFKIEFKNIKVNSKGKEIDTFEIDIINTLTNNVIPFKNLSAGQKIIVEMAISFGTNKLFSTGKMRTILLDEIDGELDEKNLRVLYNTYEQILRELDICQIFAVSHKYEVIKGTNSFIKLEYGKGTY